jgi:hypothetical protein
MTTLGIQKPRPAIPDFLEEVSIIPGAFPMERMREVWERGDEFEDVLVAYLEWLGGPEQPGWDLPDHHWLHFVAFYLLSDRASPRLFDPLVSIAFDEEYSDLILGDSDTEDLPGWLRVSGKGREQDLRSIVANPEASEWLRVAALSALGGMAWEGTIPEDSHKDYLRGLPDILPREPVFVWNEWLSHVIAFRMEDQLEAVERIEGEGLFGDFNEGLKWAREEIANASHTLESERTLFHKRPGGTAGLEEFATFECFEPGYHERLRKQAAERKSAYAYNPYDPPPLNLPFIREEPKIGRNDPCPCGSGKKWKKCCG